MTAIKTLEIHPSEVNSALLCELRLDEELKERDPDPSLMRGSLLHGHIEHHLKAEPFDPLEFMLDRLVTEYNYDSFEDAGISDLSLTRVMVQAEVAFNAWKTEVLPWLKLGKRIQVEREHRVLIGGFTAGEHGYNVELVGSPDLMDEMPVIHDWKSAERAWDPVRVVNQAQPPLYGHLARPGKLTPFWFWVFDYGTEAWVRLPAHPTQAQVVNMLRLAVKVAVKRELGLLTASPGVPGFGKTRGWWCTPKYCESWNNCSQRKLVNDGNDDVVRVWKEKWIE